MQYFGASILDAVAVLLPLFGNRRPWMEKNRQCGNAVGERTRPVDANRVGLPSVERLVRAVAKIALLSTS